jgi:hypothetical protein
MNMRWVGLTSLCANNSAEDYAERCREISGLVGAGGDILVTVNCHGQQYLGIILSKHSLSVGSWMPGPVLAEEVGRPGNRIGGLVMVASGIALLLSYSAIEGEALKILVLFLSYRT